jgi:hypothetical protein
MAAVPPVLVTTFAADSGCRLDAILREVKHSTQKERRICDTLEPVVSSHRLIVNHGLIKKDFESTQERPSEDAQKYQLFYQLTRITRERGALLQDDRLDALAIAVAHFVQAMARDVDKAVQTERDRAMDRELRRFMGHVLGHKPTPPRWAARG